MASDHTANGASGQPLNWAPMLGLWKIGGDEQVYQGVGDTNAARGQSFPVAGLAISDSSLQTGACEVRIRFSAPFGEREQSAGIVLGYRSADRRYVYAELGGAHRAYSIGESVNGYGGRPLAAAGQLENLMKDRDYLVQVRISGQELTMLVDGIAVLEHILPQPLEGRQVGLIAAGDQEVAFSGFKGTAVKPKAFVVMQFAEPYDTFYREVIQKQAEEAGFTVFRIDEKAGPGVILQYIQGEIEQSAVVIAEITPANPNVFYEVGYAHALAKPTILLAKRGSELPFDIRSFRVVFYNDTIGGKAEVEQSLHNHLKAVAGR